MAVSRKEEVLPTTPLFQGKDDIAVVLDYVSYLDGRVDRDGAIDAHTYTNIRTQRERDREHFLGEINDFIGRLAVTSIFIVGSRGSGGRRCGSSSRRSGGTTCGSSSSSGGRSSGRVGIGGRRRWSHRRKRWGNCEILAAFDEHVLACGKLNCSRVRGLAPVW